MAGERYRQYGITQQYGNPDRAYSKGYNRGVDYGLPEGTPIEADYAGQVIDVGYHSQWGRYVKVRDRNGYTQQYSHLSEVSTQVGDTIAEGDVIGLSGSTGLATGPHLDYMILDTDGNDISPDSYPKGAEDEERDFLNPPGPTTPPTTPKTPTTAPTTNKLPDPEEEGQVIEWPLASGRIQRYQAESEIGVGADGKLISKLRWKPIGAPYRDDASGPAFSGTKEGIQFKAQLDKEADAALAAINKQLAQLKADAEMERDKLKDAFDRDDLAEKTRASKALEAINIARLELDKAKQIWTERSTARSQGLEEHRNRIQEAGVTGFYRPREATPMPRVGQQFPIPGAAATLHREQATMAPTPGVGQPAATKAPLDGNSTLADMAEQYKAPQTGPAAQGQAALSPTAQPNEQPINAHERQIKKRVTETFG